MPIFTVKSSPKTAIPTQTAVTGSMVPSTEVRVDPMLLTERRRARLETVVGINANKISLFQCLYRLNSLVEKSANSKNYSCK